MNTVSQKFMLGKPIMPQKSESEDCYFYFYSSCTKGDLCPYRHEPAALKNETVCKYWLQGSCNKNNCMFRHMELKTNRSNIQCYHESQPSGCKKVHCPFLHNNVLDHPREEDIAKKPDIILPLKSNKMKGFDETLTDIISSAKNSSRVVIAPSFDRPVAPRCIVSLQDDDSDDGSPLKKTISYQPPGFTDEIRKLAEIIEAESTIVGYNHNEFPQIPSTEYYSDENDAVHRRIKMVNNGIQITSKNNSLPARSRGAGPRDRFPVEISSPPDINVSVETVVSVNGRLRDQQSSQSGAVPRSSIKSRLGKLPAGQSAVQQTGALRTAASSRHIRERITLAKDRVQPCNGNVTESHSIDARLSSANPSRQRGTVIHTSMTVAAERDGLANACSTDFSIKSLREIRDGKRKRSDSSSFSQGSSSKHTTSMGGSSNATVGKQRKHKPIVFDASVVSPVMFRPNQKLIKSTSTPRPIGDKKPAMKNVGRVSTITKPAASSPVVVKSVISPPGNKFLRPSPVVTKTALAPLKHQSIRVSPKHDVNRTNAETVDVALETSVDSFMEDDLLDGAILDYDEEELDEDLLLNC